MQHQHFYMQQHQDYMVGTPWLPPQPVVATVPAAEPPPYGRALSNLRHNHDAAIIDYFKSRGLIAGGSAPAASRVADAFKQLCVMRASNTLPSEAA
eukprot:1218-Heterococcus_DN1.PRE.1